MTTESAIRRKASRHGYAVRKSRRRPDHCYNFGDYMLLDSRTSFVVFGEHFDATLGDIESFLNETDGREAA